MIGGRGFFGSLFGRGEKEEQRAVANPERAVLSTWYLPGTLIANRYEVVRPPLAGGMGVVYLCLDRQQDLPVALKTFQPKYLSDRAARDRFLREGTIWTELGRHPHIVRAHRIDYGGHGLEVYLVLEWVAEAEGKGDASLRQWLLPGRPLPLEQTLLFALHIARGMKHATTTRPDLVHRDLKPGNVLVGRDGQAKVTDFGLIQTVAGADDAVQATAPIVGEGRLTQPGHTPGTPHYMAPEQWRGETVDARADIYAFGCILYELVSGRMAVTETDIIKISEAHLDGRVAQRAQALPGEVGRLVQRCVATDRTGRDDNWAAVEEAVMQAYRAVTGRQAPAEPKADAETRAERVQAGWSYNAIGMSYMDISKFEVAVPYFERALQIGQAEQERAAEGRALGNLGTASAALGEPRRALGYHEQALAIAREIGDRAAEGRALGVLGAAYATFGEPRLAIGYCEQHLAIAREIGDVMGAAMASFNLALPLSEEGQQTEALRYAEHAAQVFTQVGHPQYAQQAEQLLAQLRGQIKR